jgi:hypothetical protein
VTDHLDLIFARHLTGADDSRRRHARAAASGAEVRISRGAYLAADAFDALDERQRYLLRIRSIAETRRARPVISHWSAAALHRLPMLGHRTSVVHITQPVDSGLRSANGVVRHSAPLLDSEVVEIGGILVTSISRTVLDLAACEDALAAVALADAALHVPRFGRRPPLTTPELLRQAWELRLPFRGHARSLDVIGFAVTNAETPIESVSRVTMRTIGCPAPALQVPHFDSRGFIGETDFYWDEYWMPRTAAVEVPRGWCSTRRSERTASAPSRAGWCAGDGERPLTRGRCTAYSAARACRCPHFAAPGGERVATARFRDDCGAARTLDRPENHRQAWRRRSGGAAGHGGARRWRAAARRVHRWHAAARRRRGPGGTEHPPAQAHCRPGLRA